jgi:hypothetical protein
MMLGTAGLSPTDTSINSFQKWSGTYPGSLGPAPAQHGCRVQVFVAGPDAWSAGLASGLASGLSAAEDDWRLVQKVDDTTSFLFLRPEQGSRFLLAATHKVPRRPLIISVTVPAPHYIRCIKASKPPAGI